MKFNNEKKHININLAKIKQSGEIKMRGRLKNKLNEKFINYLLKPLLLEDYNRSFDTYLDINFAHTLMLKKQNIIDAETSKKLIKALWECKETGSETIELKAEYEDLYFNIENFIIEKVGQEVGGKMHTARSRNDICATACRIDVRKVYLRICSLLVSLRETLIKLAYEHIQTIMTGYTHFQPAQPITFGFYCIAILQALERDSQRLLASYSRLNQCPLGSCALAGTSFPIDRYYVSDLLGFDDIIKNTLDGVASRDYVLEIASNWSICGSNLSRFVNDLYIWSTLEFSLINIDDSIAICSSIMPQKKNPVTLEHIKGKVSHLLAALVSISGCLKNVPYSHCQDVNVESLHLFWDASSQMEIILLVFIETLRNITVNKKRALVNTNSNFCGATELADELVKRLNISFRTAHSVVGELVAGCIEKGRGLVDITIQDVENAIQKYSKNKTDVNWSQKELLEIVDAEKSVKGKISIGAPSPVQGESTLKELESTLQKDIQKLNLLIKNINKSKEFLMKQIKENIE